MSDMKTRDNQGETDYKDLLFDWKAPKVQARPTGRRQPGQPKAEPSLTRNKVQPSSGTGAISKPASSSEGPADEGNSVKPRSSKMQSLTQEELRILLSGGSLEKKPVRTEDMHLFSEAGMAAKQPVQSAAGRTKKTVQPEARSESRLKAKPLSETKAEPVSEVRKRAKPETAADASAEENARSAGNAPSAGNARSAGNAPSAGDAPSAENAPEDLLGLGGDEQTEKKPGFGFHKSAVRKPQMRKPQIRPSAAISEPRKEESTAADAAEKGAPSAVSERKDGPAETKKTITADSEEHITEPASESRTDAVKKHRFARSAKRKSKITSEPSRKTLPASRDAERDEDDFDYDDPDDDEHGRDSVSGKDKEGLPILKIGVILVAMAIVLLAIVFAALKFRDVKPVEKQETVQELKYDQLSDFVTEDYLTVNSYSRPGIHTDTYTGIVLHNTENPGKSAKEVRDYFESLADSHETRASANYVIDEDGSVIACVPLGEVAYASNSRNLDTISIEYCYSDESGKMSDAAYKSLIGLCRLLCQKYSLSSSDVIRHFDITEKSCPKYFVDNPEAWTEFRADLADALK